MHARAEDLIRRYGYPGRLRAILGEIETSAHRQLGADLVAILLTGSIATGDYVWRTSDGTSDLLSDIDAVTIVRRRRRCLGYMEDLARLSREWKGITSEFKIDMATVTTREARRLVRNYQYAEARLTGFLLEGNEAVLAWLPRDFQPGYSRLAALFNLSKTLQHWPEDASKLREGKFQRMLARLVLDGAMLAYSERGLCVPGHRLRVSGLWARGWVSERMATTLEKAIEIRQGHSTFLDVRETWESVNEVLQRLVGEPIEYESSTLLAEQLTRVVPPRTLRRWAREASQSRGDIGWLIRRKEAWAAAFSLTAFRQLAETGVVALDRYGTGTALAKFSGETTGDNSFQAIRRAFRSGQAKLRPWLARDEEWTSARS